MIATENILTKKKEQVKVPAPYTNGRQVLLPRISIISSERYPHHDTNTQQVVKNASAFHEVGIPVELVLSSQANGFFDNNYDLKAHVCEYYNISNGLRIREFSTVPASNLRLEKFFHSTFATLHAVFKKEVDIIYTRNRVAALIAFIFRKKLIFETYRRLGNEFPTVMRWLAKLSGNKAFVGMILHSKVAADSMQMVGFPKEKLFVLHNGYDHKDMQPVLSKTQARKKLGLSQKEKIIVYTGNMQKNKCIEILLDLALHLPKVKFLLVGGRQEDIERLKAYAVQVGLGANVVYAGRQPINVVSEYLYAADALIIPPVSAPLEKFGRTVLPFKIFPYLAAGRPIIAPDLADMRELLRHKENAVLVQPDSPKKNAAVISKLLDNNELQVRLSEQAARTSLSLTWVERGKKFRKWLERKLRIEN